VKPAASTFPPLPDMGAIKAAAQAAQQVCTALGMSSWSLLAGIARVGGVCGMCTPLCAMASSCMILALSGPSSHHKHAMPS
jgi:hypothetical protein